MKHRFSVECILALDCFYVDAKKTGHDSHTITISDTSTLAVVNEILRKISQIFISQKMLLAYITVKNEYEHE